MAESCSITGVVTITAYKEHSDEAIAGATITLTNKRSQLQMTKCTDENGDVAFTMLLPGDYAVKAEATGFDLLTEDRITVKTGICTPLEYYLRPSDPTPTCTLLPNGWSCSRKPGHEGPCAARPVYMNPSVGVATSEPVLLGFSFDGVILTRQEAITLRKLIKGYVVGPSARSIIEKLESVQE